MTTLILYFRSLSIHHHIRHIYRSLHVVSLRISIFVFLRQELREACDKSKNRTLNSDRLKASFRNLVQNGKVCTQRILQRDARKSIMSGWVAEKGLCHSCTSKFLYKKPKQLLGHWRLQTFALAGPSGGERQKYGANSQIRGVWGHFFL